MMDLSLLSRMLWFQSATNSRCARAILRRSTPIPHKDEGEGSQVEVPFEIFPYGSNDPCDYYSAQVLEIYVHKTGQLVIGMHLSHF